MLSQGCALSFGRLDCKCTENNTSLKDVLFLVVVCMCEGGQRGGGRGWVSPHVHFGGRLLCWQLELLRLVVPCHWHKTLQRPEIMAISAFMAVLVSIRRKMLISI